MSVYTLFFDGACAPNPGPGAWGAVLFPGDRVSDGEPPVPPLRIRDAVWAGSGLLGTSCTSIVAEYGGLIGGLRGAAAKLRDADPRPLLHVVGDSEVVLTQLSGTRRTTAPRLQALHAIASHLLSHFGTISIVPVPREANTLADILAGAALRSTWGEVPLLRPCLLSTARLTVGGVTTPATHDLGSLGAEGGVCMLDSRWLRGLPSDAGGGLAAFRRLRRPPPHMVTVVGRARRYTILGMVHLEAVVALGGANPGSPAGGRRGRGPRPVRVSTSVDFAVVDELPVPAHVTTADASLERLWDAGIVMGDVRPIEAVFEPLYAQDPFWLDQNSYYPSSLFLTEGN